MLKMIAKQPYSIFPDLEITTLEGVYFTLETSYSGADGSDKRNNATSLTNASFQSDGSVSFTAGDFVIPSTTFTTQIYWINESGQWNRYVDNGTLIYKNTVVVGSKPLTITSTGFTGETVHVKGIELYSHVYTVDEINADFQKAVPDSNVAFLTSNFIEDFSRFGAGLTPTAVSFLSRSALFPVATSVVVSDNDFAPVGNWSCAGWLRLASFGGSSLGRILDNGETILRVDDTNDTLSFASDGSTFAVSATNSLELNRWIMFGIRRAADGTCDFFVDGEINGTESQASGTPAAGTTSMHIGNDSSFTPVFDGKLTYFTVWNGSRSRGEFRNFYESTRSLIG